MSSHSYFGSAVVPFRLTFFMWAVFSIEFFYHIELGWLGIKPRTLEGLVGILTAPLVHGNLGHLVSNTVPLLFLGSLLFYFYPAIGGAVFVRCYFVTNFLVWLLSPRVSYHIGASGLIYGLSSFLIFFGLLRRDFWSLLIAIVVMVMYGGIFYAVFPGNPYVSWESHLAGSAVGMASAFNLRDSKTG